jgi:hypothetical protein
MKKEFKTFNVGDIVIFDHPSFTSDYLNRTARVVRQWHDWKGNSLIGGFYAYTLTPDGPDPYIHDIDLMAWSLSLLIPAIKPYDPEQQPFDEGDI